MQVKNLLTGKPNFYNAVCMIWLEHAAERTGVWGADCFFWFCSLNFAYCKSRHSPVLVQGQSRSVQSGIFILQNFPHACMDISYSSCSYMLFLTDEVGDDWSVWSREFFLLAGLHLQVLLTFHQWRTELFSSAWISLLLFRRSADFFSSLLSKRERRGMFGEVMCLLCAEC